MGIDSLFYHKVTVISEGLQATLKLPKKRTYILPLGADEISFVPKEYNTLDILYVGAIQHRNIYQTVTGLSLFINKYPHARSNTTYTIIGFGAEKDIKQLQDTIEKHSVTDLVNYVGRVKYTDLKPYFEKCNVGVSYIPVTAYYQHQPATKTFEYALSGLIIIATNTFENKKVIEKDNGVLCDDTPEGFANALEYIYWNKSYFNETAIRQSLWEYHWETIVNTKLIPILT